MKKLPKVKSEVTPRPIRAAISLGFIQNVIQDNTTMSPEGKYVCIT